MIQKLQKRLMNIVNCLRNLGLGKKCHLHLSWKILQVIVIFQIQLPPHQINIVKLNIGFVQLMNIYKWVILLILLVFRLKKIDWIWKKQKMKWQVLSVIKCAWDKLKKNRKLYYKKPQLMQQELTKKLLHRQVLLTFLSLLRIKIN